MMDRARNVVILGSTGSVGTQALDVIASSGGRLRAWGLTAHRQLATLCEQARRYDPAWVLATDEDAAESFDWSGLAGSTRYHEGEARLRELLADDEVDVVVAAIVGSAGLSGTWAALEAGKTVALANKEALVMGGPLVTRLAADRGGALIPVDSEHSAVYQALGAGRRSDVRRIVLTASGGPFREHSLEELRQVTVEQALAHPTWDMGPKITVDSATMMNKALEIIEARWLFDLAPDQIEVVVHPQSIVHSLVEFLDGSVVAQLGPPDMKLPIQYALSCPERWDGPAERLDWNATLSLDFEPADTERFPALDLGHEVAAAGGTAGAVLNAANEAAVAEFLDGRLAFHEIVTVCRSILDQHPFDSDPTLDRLLELDGWARQEVTRWVCT